MSGDGQTEHGARTSAAQDVDTRVAAVVGPLVQARGLDLEAVERTGSGESTVVRIVVDADAGTVLDDLADLSRELSTALDDADPDPLAGIGYTLEVTSPGVDRPLTRPGHWRRAQGRKVTATVRSEAGAEERLAGRIGRLDEADGIVDLVLPGKRGTFDVRPVVLADVTSAVVGVDFSPPGPTELALCGLDGADARREGNR